MGLGWTEREAGMSPELVKQAAELRAMATRARRLAGTINPDDGQTILAYTKELEQQRPNCAG